MLNVMWQVGWEGSLGENEYMYMYSWILLLFTLNYHNIVCWLAISSVQFSRSVMSDSLQPHELQHTRPPCPSPTPGVHPNSCLSSQWCHPAISSSVIPFSPCPQSLPVSGSFTMSQLFTWGGQSIGVSALASVLPKNTQSCLTLCDTMVYTAHEILQTMPEYWSG